MLHFQTPGPQISAMLKTRPNFALLTPVKIRGGVDVLSGQIVGASPTADTHLMAVLCATAECRVTGKNKESTAVKLKAFRLTSDCLIKMIVVIMMMVTMTM